MIESRCGVLCNICERKEKVKCSGCTTMKRPFWGGICKVKTCCENKNYMHCGECPTFPCEMLSNMGKDLGFDPLPKIEQCKKWLLE